MIKGLLFDLDGVIVDTAKYHFLAWKSLCDQLGFKFDLADNELLKGVSRIRSFNIILELNNQIMSEEEVEKYCTLKNELYLKYINNLTEDEILPGVREFMADARKRNYGIALGSASKNSRLILDKLHLTDMFDVIIDGNKVSNAKPDPEVFTKGAEELGLKAEECVVFEDSVAGIVAAHNGNMKAIGVTNPEVTDYCDYYIKSFLNLNIDVLMRKVEGE